MPNPPVADPGHPIRGFLLEVFPDGGGLRPAHFAVAIPVDAAATARAVLDGWGEGAYRGVAGRRGRGGLGYRELTQLPEIRASIERLMRKANRRLERWEQVKRFTILDGELSLAEGTLTPSLKVRRDEVRKVYAGQIEAMYADDPSTGVAGQ